MKPNASSADFFNGQPTKPIQDGDRQTTSKSHPPILHPSNPLPVERFPELFIRRDIDDFGTIRNVKFEKLCVKFPVSFDVRQRNDSNDIAFGVVL